jgi:hypothetical protein
MPDQDPGPRPCVATDALPGELRAAQRYPSNQDARCHPPVASPETTPARVRDVSSHGVGLLVPRRFEPGTVLILELGAADRRVPVLARVVRLVVWADGEWLVGCSFVGEISTEELLPLLADRDASSPPERGITVRLPEAVVALCCPDSVG